MNSMLREVETCPICRSTAKTVIYQSTLDLQDPRQGPLNPYGAHYAINRCDGCGLLLSNPVLGETHVQGLYQHADTTNVVDGEEDNVRRTMNYYYRLVKPYLLGKERLLDVGCDLGFLLDAASRDGFAEVHGLEPNPTARQRARTVRGAVVSDQFYENQFYPDCYFDLITLIHVLDHVFNPREVIERALGHLKPGGVLFAVVHNVESLLGRVLGERFPVFNLYHHYFFSKHTLRALCEAAGFQVPLVVSTKNCYSLRFFVHKLPGLPRFMKKALSGMLTCLGLGWLPLTLPLGNIGVIARRPSVGW